MSKEKPADQKLSWGSPGVSKWDAMTPFEILTDEADTDPSRVEAQMLINRLIAEGKL